MWECRASRDSSHLALCATLSCCDILVRAPPPCLSPLPPPRLAPPCRTVYLPVFTSKLATVHICQKKYPASSTSSFIGSWWKMEPTRPRAGQLGRPRVHPRCTHNQPQHTCAECWKECPLLAPGLCTHGKRRRSCRRCALWCADHNCPKRTCQQCAGAAAAAAGMCSDHPHERQESCLCRLVGTYVSLTGARSSANMAGRAVRKRPATEIWPPEPKCVG